MEEECHLLRTTWISKHVKAAHSINYFPFKEYGMRFLDITDYSLVLLWVLFLALFPLFCDWFCARFL